MNERELKLRVKYLGRVVDCLESVGLVVNTSKTVAMLQLAGTQHKKWQSLLVHRGVDGAHLLLPRKNGHARLRLVQSVVHLGVRISYTGFETATQVVRTNAANKSVLYLSRWLYSKRRLPFRTRLQLWQTRIVPCTEYGLLAVGLTQHSPSKHIANLMKQLRIITGNLSHHTHDSHLAVLHQLGLEHPVESLRRAAQARVCQHERNLQTLTDLDIVVTNSCFSLADSIGVIDGTEKLCTLALPLPRLLLIWTQA